MAAAAAAAVAATQPSSSENATEGPVLNLINKRLRALRKKLNRISQMEESVSQGKALNKEQEETLRSKSSVLAGIDELEKLRHPLLQAVDQEIELALGKIKPNPGIDITDIPSEADAVEAEAESGTVPPDSVVSDLLILLYFGTIFDVKTLYLARDNMLTRTHERNCCLTYDCITDDNDAAGDLLKDQDLDSIAALGGLLLSRPVNSTLSHMNALQKCVEHAKLWLANVEQPIEPGSNVTYAGLREKLHKIMASEYFTTTPEIKDAGEVAAAGGNYASFQVAANRQEEEEVPDSREDAGIDQDSRDVDSKKQNPTRDKSHPGFQGGRGRGGRRGYGGGRGGGRGGSRGGDYGYGRRGGRGGMGGGNYNHHGPAGSDYAPAAS